MNPFDLTGRLAVVTGCRRGIGLAMAEALAAAGADIIGVSAAMEPDGSEAGRRVTALGRAFTPYRAPVVAHEDADWEHVLEVDLSVPFRLARDIGRGMLDRGSGKVIFTASMLSFQGGVNVVSYAAAKSAIAGITRALANEWAGSGVNVNAIAPGYIATDNTQALWKDSERYQAILGRIPAGRWGRPEDVGGATVFLASDAANYVHGTVLAVDGGWLAR
jgi:2-deoxy-D-gluconate 3-dehydrogenase